MFKIKNLINQRTKDLKSLIFNENLKLLEFLFLKKLKFVKILSNLNIIYINKIFIQLF